MLFTAYVVADICRHPDCRLAATSIAAAMPPDRPETGRTCVKGIALVG